MRSGVAGPALVGPSDLVMLISADRKQFIFRLRDGGD